MLCDHCFRLCVVFFTGCLVISALLMYFVMCTSYQTTNEKYHTQTNTMITKHNR